MLKIRRPLGRLIFNMGIAIPGKTVFLIETAPWLGGGHVVPPGYWVEKAGGQGGPHLWNSPQAQPQVQQQGRV